MNGALILVLSLGWYHFAEGLEGHKECAFGSADCSVCAPDIAIQFDSLKHHGEVLGFHMGGFDDDVSFGSNHWQGVTRLSTRFGKYLALSTGTDDNGGKMRVVKMTSRKGGKRFRSNRLKRDLDTDETMPPRNDKIIYSTRPNTSMKHGGGMDSVGKWAAVAMDKPTHKDCDKSDSKACSVIVFYDMADPRTPVKARSIVRKNKAAGSVGLTKLSDGRYLVAVSGYDGSHKLDLYYMDSLEGSDYTAEPDQVLDFKDGSDMLSGCWPRDSVASCHGHSFQGFSLVNQCDGTVFLIGLQNTQASGLGEDHAYLYELVEQNGKIKLRQAGTKHFYCDWSSAGTACNFAASGTAFVDKDGNLILYSTEHGNAGPSNTVKMAEFRNMYGNKDWSCAEAGSSWIELYDDDNFKDRSVVMDFDDRLKNNFENLNNLDGFNDKTSSMLWCLRSGCTGTIYWNDNYGGHKIVLHQRQGQRHDMPSVNWEGRNWNDQVSSVKMEGNC